MTPVILMGGFSHLGVWTKVTDDGKFVTLLQMRRVDSDNSGLHEVDNSGGQDWTSEEVQQYFAGRQGNWDGAGLFESRHEIRQDETCSLCGNRGADTAYTYGTIRVPYCTSCFIDITP